MAIYHITLRSTHPETIIEEVIEIEAGSSGEAVEAVLEGDGYQLKTTTSYGEPDDEVVTAIRKA